MAVKESSPVDKLLCSRQGLKWQTDIPLLGADASILKILMPGRVFPSNKFETAIRSVKLHCN